ncbi:MAG: helix-turn-helix domain-containing protein [Chloroflexi bacterium]|nr:helix-turn-helix domain-containing protein [Chloroflexota bacterium]
MRQTGQPRNRWDADSIRALRLFLDVSQSVFANYLGVRQQTVSEWETGVYRPRGASGTLLSLIAEQAGFRYTRPAVERQPTPVYAVRSSAPQQPSFRNGLSSERTPSPPDRATRAIADRDEISRGYVPYVPPALRPSPRPPQNLSGPSHGNEIAF